MIIIFYVLKLKLNRPQQKHRGGKIEAQFFFAYNFFKQDSNILIN